MSNFQTFYAAFKAHLENNWQETPIVKTVNSPGGFDGFTPFITYKTDLNVTSTSSVSGLGGGGIRSKFRDVIMQVTIFVPSSSGEDVLIDLCQKMEDLFNNAQITPGSFTRDMVTDDVKDQSNGLWFGREVGIYFENREFNIN